MEELRPGLWTWTAPHPDWKPKDGGPNGWEQEVRCYAVGSVLVDPLDPPLDGTAVVLTVRYHARSSRDLGLPVHVSKWDAKRIPGSLPYSPGDELPGGVEAVPSYVRNEHFVWVPGHGALISGDILLGDGDGGIRLHPDSWLPRGKTRADAIAGLRHLLDLPVELVLPTHGDPAPGAALRAALA